MAPRLQPGQLPYVIGSEPAAYCLNLNGKPGVATHLVVGEDAGENGALAALHHKVEPPTGAVSTHQDAPGDLLRRGAAAREI